MRVTDSEPLFQTLFERSPDAIFIEDVGGNVLDCNPAAAALHGMPREQIIGKNVTELVPPGSRPKIVTLRTGGSPESKASSLNAYGRAIPISVRTSRIGSLGQPALMLNVRDFTS